MTKPQSGPTVDSTRDGSDERFNTRNGVFYPTGFALLGFADDAARERAIEIARRDGVGDADLTLLTAAQVHELGERSQREAGILSRIVSAELKQMTVLEQLADAGHSFILVKATDDNRPLLDRIGNEAPASKGLLFHTLAIEELPVPKETIPGKSPFGMNEVIRTQDSDADMTR